MKTKRIISGIFLILAVLMLFSCSAENKAKELESMEYIMTLRIWDKAQPYAYDLRLGEDTVLYATEYKLEKGKTEYTLNSAGPEYAKSVKEKALTGRELEKVGKLLSSFDGECREKGGDDDGSRIHLNYNGIDYYYTYGQCLDKGYDELVTLLCELSPIEVTELSEASDKSVKTEE